MGNSVRFRAGMRFESKKPHPCSGREWEVISIGADYKLKCLKCGRTVILDYDKASGMIKRIIEPQES